MASLPAKIDKFSKKKKSAFAEISIEAGVLIRQELNVQAVTGIFLTRADANCAIEKLGERVPSDKITLLTPTDTRDGIDRVPADTAEQPGMGKGIGAIIGAAAGLSGGTVLVAAMVPGVGPVTAIGLIGGAILAAAGAKIGAVAGESLENRMTEGLPEDELFVYEDALRKGRTVVIALAEDAVVADELRALLKSCGATAIDAARHQWWIGLRSAEREHYAATGRSFQDEEKFYRMGFEAALHARSRCKEFDQVSAEMASNIEDLQEQYPDEQVAEAYARGYQRGREYYQHLCDESKAA